MSLPWPNSSCTMSISVMPPVLWVRLSADRQRQRQRPPVAPCVPNNAAVPPLLCRGSFDSILFCMPVLPLLPVLSSLCLPLIIAAVPCKGGKLSARAVRSRLLIVYKVPCPHPAQFALYPNAETLPPAVCPGSDRRRAIAGRAVIQLHASASWQSPVAYPFFRRLHLCFLISLVHIIY